MTQLLANKRIVVTRPRARAEELSARLAALGAHVILCPVIETVPLDDYSGLDAAIRATSSYDWVVFTSVNGVEAFSNRSAIISVKNPVSLQCKVAAVGPATAAALQSHGLQPALVPQRYIAEGLTSDLGKFAGQHILLLRAERARHTLPNDLRAQGALVADVACYRTVTAAPGPSALADLQLGTDLITFTSSSAVAGFAELVRQLNLQVRNTPVACLGPITAATARQMGFTEIITASTYTTNGLVSAITDYYTKPHE